jgi:hypothetical protein
MVIATCIWLVYIHLQLSGISSAIIFLSTDVNKWINNESAECVLPHGQFIMLSLLICLEIDFFHGVQIICIATGVDSFTKNTSNIGLNVKA